VNLVGSLVRSKFKIFSIVFKSAGEKQKKIKENWEFKLKINVKLNRKCILTRFNFTKNTKKSFTILKFKLMLYR